MLRWLLLEGVKKEQYCPCTSFPKYTFICTLSPSPFPQGELSHCNQTAFQSPTCQFLNINNTDIWITFNIFYINLKNTIFSDIPFLLSIFFLTPLSHFKFPSSNPAGILSAWVLPTESIACLHSFPHVSEPSPLSLLWFFSSDIHSWHCTTHNHQTNGHFPPSTYWAEHNHCLVHIRKDNNQIKIYCSKCSQWPTKGKIKLNVLANPLRMAQAWNSL